MSPAEIDDITVVPPYIGRLPVAMHKEHRPRELTV
jgi:hypothetical protein